MPSRRPAATGRGVRCQSSLRDRACRGEVARDNRNVGASVEASNRVTTPVPAAISSTRCAGMVRSRPAISTAYGSKIMAQGSFHRSAEWTLQTLDRYPARASRPPLRAARGSRVRQHVTANASFLAQRSRCVAAAVSSQHFDPVAAATPAHCGRHGLDGAIRDARLVDDCLCDATEYRRVDIGPVIGVG